MREFQFRDLSAQGPVSCCRELCNRLMQHQAEQSTAYRSLFSTMCFENRLEPAFAEADPRFLLAAFDGSRPVGYVFCDAALVTEDRKALRPRIAADFPPELEGLYPRSLPVPAVCGHLSNLYVLPEYRGSGLGAALTDRAMAWLRSVPDCRHIFVHVSQGNSAGAFYERYGFRRSHGVCGDLLQAYVLDL